MERVKEIRNYLHTIPEPSSNEVKTSAYLAGELKKAGFEVTTNVGGHGVVGLLKGTDSGPVVAVRGDMDALTHAIGGKTVCVHSCGHDANCAMVLAAVEEVAKTGIKRGTLKVIFQPAEENLMGAKGVIEAGAGKDIDYMFGIHLRPKQEAVLGQATPALYHGASGHLLATIHGTTAHGARPHLGVNAIDAAALVVGAINGIWEDPADTWSAKVTKFISNGIINNAIPDGVDMAVDMRGRTTERLNSIIDKVKNMIAIAPTAIGATGEVTFCDWVPGAAYDDEAVGILSDGIVAVMGQSALVPKIASSGADDFHYYKYNKPAIKAAFVGLGADLTPGLHNPEMSFNDDALPSGAGIIKFGINKLLN
ncbi:M20 peptidase aminoacylase family protein [Deferribacterales bacterium RsTz2092]|nr:amidohydrolase [Deferribacterales bacterium]